ncbi:unnamed protein product [Umbelopsis vinacea]
MLPLDPKNNYNVEILICGGSKGVEPIAKAEDTCGRINLGDKEPKWEMDTLTARSCFSIDAREDLQDTTSENLDPTFDPLIYDRKQPKGKRWRQALADTDIARVYRSVALGLPDGRVWVAGSNNIEPAKTNVEYHFTPQSAGLNTFLLYTYSNRQSDLWCPMCQKCWPMGKNTA